MNYKRYIFAVLFIPFVGLGEGATQGTLFCHPSAPAQVAAPAPLLPVIDYDFADLDVRDAHNQPVSNPSARAQLLALFTETAYQLAIEPASHELRLVWDLLDQLSALLNKLIWAHGSHPIGAFCQALKLGSRRFVHNVHKLWISFSDGSLYPPPPSHSTFSPPTFLRLILRC